MTGQAGTRKLEFIDIGHPDYVCLVDPEPAFWALVKRNGLENVLAGGKLLGVYRKKARAFSREMDRFRFTQKPSAVYFNPTERCNLNCSYCYIPEKMRSNGQHMSESQLLKALGILKSYFSRTLPEGALPQIVFHGAEPLLNRNAVFCGIERYRGEFRFGIQTNATLLDDQAVEFLTKRNISIGLSLDAPTASIADRTRKNWNGKSVYKKVIEAMERLQGYPNWSVIGTVTQENMSHLTEFVEFLHQWKVPTCLLNIVRCTLPASRSVKPDDDSAAQHLLAALDRTYELYRQTGRKLPVANFANILLAIIAPTARRLMCDISPCGGGRCFFAMAPTGDLYPCSEFIGLPSFKGGNIFHDPIDEILISQPFKRVTERMVEKIEPCRRCAIRNFCGSPCPAEAQEMNGGMNQAGAFCKFYEELIYYAFRLIADGKQESYLWDDWDKNTTNTFAL
ncbi:MAG: peptide-modifying radical SAM enzyme CbpB [Elusimicrobia bacterium]|nr:peptide-modifying radical SAM enzyme CbpB [Elusimicrobiota bacterium]